MSIGIELVVSLCFNVLTIAETLEEERGSGLEGQG